MNQYPFTFRDPVHGFIEFNELEWDVINSDAFQRLRRVRQLSWTDLVYPGAMHTRFEHSLGVCHVATKIFDSISEREADLLKSEYKLYESGLERQRQVIRLGALMHDLGHGPFSHAAEELFPFKDQRERYQHEEYSAKIAYSYLDDLLKNHPYNRNHHISLSDVTELFSGKSTNLYSALWKEIISGQMDADRMDYLIRDSHHCGVSYGRYDLDRVINTLCLCEDLDFGGHFLGVEEDGIHSVEGLLVARYMMFTQVYFHKTRVIYDYHYEEALRSILKESGSVFPPPTVDGIREYFDWDDWRVLAELKAGGGGEHGRRLWQRDHFRLVYSTPEVPNSDDLAKFDQVVEKLHGLDVVLKDAQKSWYKFRREEIRVKTQNRGKKSSVPLATMSPIVKGLATVNQRRIYVPKEARVKAQALLN